MNLPNAVFVIRWLVRDTLRQARANGLLWLMLGLTAVATAFCLTIAIEGDAERPPLRPWEDPAYLPRSEIPKYAPEELIQSGIDVPTGELRLLFGAFRIPLTRSRAEAVRSIELLLAGALADTAGVLLALIWTAGILPNFLDPSFASVMLAKPARRSWLLAGKIAGVLVAVGLLAIAFIGLTWLALGLRTGVWDARYFSGVPILLVHFAVFFCVSAWLAVATRSTVAAALGSLGFWAVCWGVNYVRHVAAAAGGVPPLLDAAYWLLPKPVDLGVLLMEALEARSIFGQDAAIELLHSRGEIALEAALLTSLLVPLAAYIAAVRRLTRAEF